MKNNDEYTGGSVSYYQVEIAHPLNQEALPYTAECQDIIDALGMTFNEGNAFKALWRRCAARTLGKAADGLRDAEKVVFYGERLVQLEQLQRQRDGVEQSELPLPAVKVTQYAAVPDVPQVTIRCCFLNCDKNAVAGSLYCEKHGAMPTAPLPPLCIRKGCQNPRSVGNFCLTCSTA